MTKFESENRRKFVNTMFDYARMKNPSITKGEVAKVIETLHRHNATLQRLYSYHCGGAKEQMYINLKKETSLEERCQELSKILDCSLAINTDPRGYPLEFWHGSYLYKFGW